ncbi:hypothetical protein F5887DRAFT_1162819 [Amanita rubescens]|nr:hypothetical protein F5887DRAFT_1162819 [Amanita rubescens]
MRVLSGVSRIYYIQMFEAICCGQDKCWADCNLYDIGLLMMAVHWWSGDSQIVRYALLVQFKLFGAILTLTQNSAKSNPRVILPQDSSTAVLGLRRVLSPDDTVSPENWTIFTINYRISYTRSVRHPRRVDLVDAAQNGFIMDMDDSISMDKPSSSNLQNKGCTSRRIPPRSYLPLYQNIRMLSSMQSLSRTLVTLMMTIPIKTGYTAKEKDNTATTVSPYYVGHSLVKFKLADV